MNILIKSYPAPCDHIRILRADTGAELLVTTKAEINQPLSEGDILGCLKVLVRNAPVTGWRDLKTYLEAREF